MAELEAAPPDSMAELCKEASNQSVDFGLTCTSLTEKLKILTPILTPITTQEPGDLPSIAANLTPISVVNAELEAAEASHPVEIGNV